MAFNEVSVFKLTVYLTDYNENISWVTKISQETMENLVSITDLPLL